ncbi:MAG: lantibiotic dehydratase, partial [Terriglobales bacterium]
MNPRKQQLLYQHLDVALMRASSHTAHMVPASWPNLDDEAEVGRWRTWLIDTWSQRMVASAVRLASPALADRLDTLGNGAHLSVRQVRRMVLALARYVVRMRGRATPFGLLAGVTTARFGPLSSLHWVSSHKAVSRADARWLASIIDRLEASTELSQRLTVKTNDLTLLRGKRLVVPWQPHGTNSELRSADEISLRCIPVLHTILQLASSPVPVRDLRKKLACEHLTAFTVQIDAFIGELVAHGVLIT